MTANIRTLTREMREVPMTDTRATAGNSARLDLRTKAFGVIPSQMIWGIMACFFIFLSSQLSNATGTCTTVTGGSGFGVTDNNTVLMLATTLTDNTGSPAGNLCTSVEAAQANALNFNVEIDDAAAWGAKSTANFATYRAIVLGDPDCVGPGTGPITEAESTSGTWGPAITGPVAVVGTDPEFHSIINSPPQSTTATQLTENAIAYATSTSGQPGAYISLSCYYFTSAANTPVPVLAPFGSFTVQGQAAVNDTATIVAPTNALVTTPNALNDTGLSHWGESMHEAFNSFPSNFTEVVHSNDRNLPYILAGNPPQTQTAPPGETITFNFQGGFAAGGYDYTVHLNTGSATNVQLTPIIKTQAQCDALVNVNFPGAHCFVYQKAAGDGTNFAAMFELTCPDLPGSECATFDAELGTDYHFDKAFNPGFNNIDPFPGWLKGRGPDSVHPCTPNPDPVTNPLFQSNQIDFFQVQGDPTGVTKGGSGGTGSCWVATYNTPNEVPPGITINSPTATTYTLNQTVAASYFCSDPSSSKLPQASNPTGPYLTNVAASCLGPIASGTNIDTSAAALGPHTFTVNAIDTGSNTASKSVSYSVGYQSSGTCDGDAGHQVLQPINTPPQALSVFKGGSTIAVKFRVCDANGVSIGTAGVVTSNPFACTITGSTGGPIDETFASATPDTNFRWDSTNQQWIFNWGTKGLAAGGTKYSCTITLNDTSKISFSLALK
jgi:hypothetical protein